MFLFTKLLLFLNNLLQNTSFMFTFVHFTDVSIHTNKIFKKQLLWDKDHIL